MPDNIYRNALRHRDPDPLTHPVRVAAHRAPWKLHKDLEEMVGAYEEKMRLAAHAYYASMSTQSDMKMFMRQAEPTIKEFVGLYRTVLEADRERRAQTRSAVALRRREREAKRNRKRTEWKEGLDE